MESDVLNLFVWIKAKLLVFWFFDWSGLWVESSLWNLDYKFIKHTMELPKNDHVNDK